MPDQARYQVLLEGLVAPESLEELEELGETATVDHEATTVVAVRLGRGAALHRYLHALRSRGLVVLDVHRRGRGHDAGTEGAVAGPGGTSPGPEPAGGRGQGP